MRAVLWAGTLFLGACSLTASDVPPAVLDTLQVELPIGGTQTAWVRLSWIRATREDLTESLWWPAETSLVSGAEPGPYALPVRSPPPEFALFDASMAFSDENMAGNRVAFGLITMHDGGAEAPTWAEQDDYAPLDADGLASEHMVLYWTGPEIDAESFELTGVLRPGLNVVSFVDFNFTAPSTVLSVEAAEGDAALAACGLRVSQLVDKGPEDGGFDEYQSISIEGRGACPVDTCGIDFIDATPCPSPIFGVLCEACIRDRFFLDDGPVPADWPCRLDDQACEEPPGTLFCGARQVYECTDVDGQSQWVHQGACVPDEECCFDACARP